MNEDKSTTHVDRDDAEGLLNARTDPGSAAFGVMGAEASSDLNWFKMLTTRVQDRAENSMRHQWWVLWSLLAGLFSLNFTFTVFIVELPKVATQFHTSITVLSWTMIGPLLAYGIAAPMFGKAGDIFGHRRLYLFGLLGAMLSAILTALAPDVTMLLFARTLDGVQGAVTGTASGALINMAFRPAERVKAMGWWSLVGAGGPVLGVSLGSPIIQAFGWRTLFWVQLVLIVIAFAVVTVVLPRRRGAPEESEATKQRAIKEFRETDWIGSWSLSFAIAALMLGLSLAPTFGWTSWVSFVALALTVLLFSNFVYRLNHVAHPLIPAHYFHQRNFVMPMVLRAVANFAYFGAFFLFPLLMEKAYGYSIVHVGAIAIARPIVFAISSPVAGYVAIRIGERVSAVAGATFLAMSLVIFSLLQPSSGAWLIVIALGLSGLGMGIAMPSSSSTMANEVLPSEFGVMSAAQMVSVQVGEVAGIEVLVSIQQALARQRGLTHSHPGLAILNTFHLPFQVGAAVAIVGIVSACFFRPFDRSTTP